MNMRIKYFTDGERHLVCVPYSIENLHIMAKELGIKRCWFHPSNGRHHYDIPIRDISRIEQQCEIISSKCLLSIIENKIQKL